ncbi:glycine--tRNA ligase [Candidatus Uhrbacteria bacterium RIFCSPLOWO2_01_FULL_47_24]|uniref:Glycine--tRNA ligase n=1 Tax=Candidatus Uhrbacteria bacterium RIFCSPLOWO2_01_FULL_47_24 TaxID=1802401 RepID=A0A1F7UP40_9BACT|nr:MAG: glycine--tRNA ligase [Candidatus Uhrbacteria bacterium RIFCSPHIGHO2_02_FULL_46_47]OGL76828.1 MAG: glycine--tRNA ligase [Candidatus Uhrbacteria bacterium RIFCSPHIGHO2_12_FULL_47_11]OGL80060.1 MAG: glycine--tRNA ligase [Candidatus Uhrbacteria bacterium RIFCSPLOWO2_01_FULL_47_24]OGL93268.1 MAG: glycine--tRNA ligase [Candidatus Uhrbacteria bacterium RIFCSPLOWO2_12_FULL_47_10]
MDKIVSLAKRRGFIFPGSEIYGGLAGTWDYGTLGAFMRDNIRSAWKKRFVQGRDDMEYLEGAVLMARKTWEASGHVAGFNDLLMECKKCHERFRADHMAEGQYVGQGKAKQKNQCIECAGKEFTEPRQFNMMFETYVGPIKDEERKTYLRPETAQSMFTNFKNVVDSARRKPPFGIGQIGKSFRNEIQTGNFIFRSREFEIAEIEYFVKPGEDDKWFEHWLNEWEKFYLDLGIKKKNLRRYEHPKESLAHYSKRTVDLEYHFPFGFGEIAGIANRTDYDLKRHIEYSGEDLAYFNSETKEKYVPYVIEPTLGIDRAFVTFLIDAYDEVEGGRTTTTESNKEVETVLRLHKSIAPIKVAVLPLSKKEPLTKLAHEIAQILRPYMTVAYDEVASIGRRYRRQDEIGTPYCVTIDFESVEDKKVTVRDRDTMKQERVEIEELGNYLKERL